MAPRGNSGGMHAPNSVKGGWSMTPLLSPGTRTSSLCARSTEARRTSATLRPASLQSEKSYEHAHTHAHIHTHTRAQKRTHAYAHTHTRTHKRAGTHTQGERGMEREPERKMKVERERESKGDRREVCGNVSSKGHTEEAGRRRIGQSKKGGGIIQTEAHAEGKHTNRQL